MGYSEKGSAVLCKGARLKYRFTNDHREIWSIITMCRILSIARAGFYVWLHNLVSAGEKDNQRLLELIRYSYTLSGGVCSRNRVAKIMRKNRIQVIHDYKVPRGTRGRTSVIAPKRFQREFTVVNPNQVWATDVTYIRTWQGWRLSIFCP